MNQPSIHITFQSQALASVQRSARGVLAIIIRQAGDAALSVLSSITDVPSALSADNAAYVNQAFVGVGGVVPSKVLLVTIPVTDSDITDALTLLQTRTFNYLVAPPDVTSAEVTAIASWLAAQRKDYYNMAKAVLPNGASDSVCVINFTTKDIVVGTKTYTAAQYCARIAGILASVPLTQSCTYIGLAEVEDVERLTQEEMDEACDDGEFILFWDGRGVKTGRAVNSLQTVGSSMTEAYKKIKVVDVMDMIDGDLRSLFRDSWVGRYANSYANKQMLVTAVKGYLATLESEGVLMAGQSSVSVDLDAQRTYLATQGVKVEDMSDVEILNATTGSEVFLTASVGILDAMEDISLVIHF